MANREEGGLRSNFWEDYRNRQKGLEDEFFRASMGTPAEGFAAAQRFDAGKKSLWNEFKSEYGRNVPQGRDMERRLDRNFIEGLSLNRAQSRREKFKREQEAADARRPSWSQARKTLGGSISQS
jgi:hypothetical protein